MRLCARAIEYSLSVGFHISLLEVCRKPGVNVPKLFLLRKTYNYHYDDRKSDATIWSVTLEWSIMLLLLQEVSFMMYRHHLQLSFTIICL